MLRSIPSCARRIYHPAHCDNDLWQDMSYRNDDLWSLGLEVEIWRHDYFSMFSCFSLLFFSYLDLGPVQMVLAWVFTTFRGSHVEVDFSYVPDLPKGHPEGIDRLRDIWVHIIVYMEQLIDCFLTISCVSYSCMVMQPGRYAPQEGDNVTARLHETCPGPGNAISYSRLATSHRSLVIILPIHLHLLSLESTFATISTQGQYVCLCSSTQSYVAIQYDLTRLAVTLLAVIIYRLMLRWLYMIRTCASHSLEVRYDLDWSGCSWLDIFLMG